MPTRKLTCEESKMGLEELLKVLVRVEVDGSGDDVLDADGNKQYVILSEEPEGGS